MLLGFEATKLGNVGWFSAGVSVSGRTRRIRDDLMESCSLRVVVMGNPPPPQGEGGSPQRVGVQPRGAAQRNGVGLEGMGSSPVGTVSRDGGTRPSR